MTDKHSDSAQDPQALIAGVDAEDLARARSQISEGVRSAQAQWIPSHLIVSALALELQEQIAGEQPSPELSLYLRRLSEFVSHHVEPKAKH